MEPEYQRRGGIWSDHDQSLLIDSIINDYDIPKLYVADFSTMASPLNTDRKRFAVVDGKQRLEALFRFFGDTLPLAKGTTLVEPPHTDLSGLYFSDIEHLYPTISSKISEYPLAVMHIVTDEMGRINELFVRLNRGSNLTGAEKRNAMIGPVPKVIRRLSEHRFFTAKVRYKSHRGQSLNAAAKLLRFELSGKAVDTKKRQLDDMVLGYVDATKSVLDGAQHRVTSCLDRMSATFGDRDPLLASQGNIPVYYLFQNSIQETGPIVREFLLGFERELRSTRKDGVSRPTDLVTYENAMRSTNDGWAYDARVVTLVRRFREFVRRPRG